MEEKRTESEIRAAVEAILFAAGDSVENERLAEALDLTFADYSEAVDQILGSEQISSLLSGDAEMVITVIGPEGAQTERILSGVRTCTGNQRNIHCYSAGAEEAEGVD